MNTTQTLQDIIAAALSIPAAQVTDDLSYQSIPEWDSVSHIYLITELEAAFNITIDTDEVLEMSSVEKVRETLRKHNVNI
ncbi:acyl carrier protein [Chitinophaga rhizophila]|uniref:Acyl carrier protein n=1 Tax=Chitinophaga rhizophila TaxID=2866212 RepID=A0ABS7G681_9BACT|nr:acyl carrier protein [Chitinophaga rhizophila]MBW8683152.1 acyl carrier protein [Chitinophaga rhizophila]